MVNKGFAIHASYAENLRAAYGDDVFDSVVPASTDYKVAVTLRKAVCEHKPKGAASKAMEAVADEMLARLGARCAGVVSGAPATKREVA